MEKTEMMKRYEVEVDKQSAILKFMSGGQALEQKSYPKLGPYDYSMDYVAWLEAKAAAYDLAVQENVAHEFTILQVLKGRIDYEGLPVSEINWLQVLRRDAKKASAYDRLMSGGKKTLKEWANFLGKPVTVDKSGAIYAHEFVPHCAFGDMWVSNLFDCMQISPNLIDYIGDWKDSLTLPDGWEEANAKQ